jgi:hypothetical protein
MAASARLTLGGFLARFAFALLVVGATYNPTPYSFYAWARSTGFEWRPPTVLAGVVLLIGWIVCVRLALRSYSGVGLLLANAFLAALYWLAASWRWLPIDNVAAGRLQRRRRPGRRHVVDGLAARAIHAVRLGALLGFREEHAPPDAMLRRQRSS